MKTLTNAEVTLMENLIGVSQMSLQNILYKFLKQNYKDVTYNKDYLITEGDIPIALVAHMDTVFKTPATEVFYDKRKNVMFSPQGAGFDDRAGIFAIIQIIKAGFRPHIIFTTDEEIGGVGAYELSFQPCPFKDLRYIIELDRRGANDCVFYECDNENFEKYIEKFGFITSYGTYTDICELGPAWKIAGVNLSIGYRDEHSVSEILFVGQMLDTIEKVKKMLSEKDIPTFKFIPGVSYYYNGYFFDDEYEYYPYKPKMHYICRGCGKEFDEEEMLEVKLNKGNSGYFCFDCLGTKVDWCRNCGEPFEVKPGSKGCCAECQKKVKKYDKFR